MFKPAKDIQGVFQGDGEYRENVLKRAEQLAASVTEPRETGDFVDSVEAAEVDGEIHLRSTDPFWHLIEFGSANNPAYAPLRRAVQAAGLRLGETPK